MAVVTGAAMGTGAATAELFAQAGAHVVVAAFDDDAGRGVVADIQRGGGTATSTKSTCPTRPKSED